MGMSHKILTIALVIYAGLAVGCTTVDSVTATVVAWRYGTPPPTLSADEALVEEVVPLGTVEALPTVTPSLTPTPRPTETPSPTPTITPIPQIVTYEDELGRFTLSYPDNWLYNDGDEEAIFFASDEQTLTTNNLEAGGIVFLFPGEANTLEEPDPAGILQLFIDNFVVFDTEEILQPVAESQVNGQAGAVASADAVFNRYPVQVSYTVLVEESRFVVVVVMLSDGVAADLRPVAQEIVGSIEVR